MISMISQVDLKTFGEGLASVVTNTYHYWRPIKRLPYAIWAEDSEDGSFDTNNRKANQQIHGVLDYFTKTEYDPTIDAIQNYLNSLNDFGWRLDSVQYEDENGIIHYGWEWWKS